MNNRRYLKNFRFVILFVLLSKCVIVFIFAYAHVDFCEIRRKYIHNDKIKSLIQQLSLNRILNIEFNVSVEKFLELLDFWLSRIHLFHFVSTKTFTFIKGPLL